MPLSARNPSNRGTKTETGEEQTLKQWKKEEERGTEEVKRNLLTKFYF